MPAAEINKCTAWSGLLFAYVAFLTGVLASALPYWITTKDRAFEFMNLGFWKYCKQIDLERTDCFWLIDDSTGVEKWLKQARITGCIAPIFLSFFFICVNVYTLPNRFQGSRRVTGLIMCMASCTIAFEVATMVLFCFGRDDHKFIDFDGPVKMAHSFYLAMACVTCLINSSMMMGCDVWETYQRKKKAYTPPSAKFLAELEREAALLKQRQELQDGIEDDFDFDDFPEHILNAYPLNGKAGGANGQGANARAANDGPQGANAIVANGAAAGANDGANAMPDWVKFRD